MFRNPFGYWAISGYTHAGETISLHQFLWNSESVTDPPDNRHISYLSPTYITNRKGGEKSVMWRNVRFQYMTGEISPHGRSK